MAEQKTLELPEMVTVGELAEKLGLPVTTLIGELFKNGIAATVNQRIDFETAQIIIEELGLEIELSRKVTGDTLEHNIHVSDDAQARPPIVAVMGHVDHGKTTLLDNILGMSKADHEAGGITQHISAYQVERAGRKITFLDTPGHETFAALRQHGAVLTDVVIIVVAADDGVKPQTVESIKFARSANAKIVIAINKIDREGANPQLVKTQLATEHGLNPEEWGGDTVMVEVSAKTGAGVDKLLDMVLLVADMEDLRADYDRPAEGLIIESKISHGRGALGRVLILNGTLKVGEYFVAGSTYGRVRTMQDWAKKPITSAGPSTPISVTGFKEVPQFGDKVTEVKNEREARALAAKHYEEQVRSTANANITGSDLLRMMNRRAEAVEAIFVVKADVQGSLTSIVDSLKLLESDEVAVKIVASGVGDITDGDIRQAESSGAIIYGFNVALGAQVKRLATANEVAVRLFNVIYELLDDAKHEIEDKLEPEIIETEIGGLEIKGVFRTTRDEIICGGLVTSGKVVPNILARVKRKKDQLGEVEVTSVQRDKNEVKEVFEGDMCGLNLATKQKLTLEIGDKLEFFAREARKREL
ncbi:MAG: translation initiation factor IF-2 [Candidatus Nomurabacteria bacterium]|jgi:translation initiation factor IF-2|nr:translation initiation factor IF-2 [Candidatus Nomurabacteria bacterium]